MSGPLELDDLTGELADPVGGARGASEDLRLYLVYIVLQLLGHRAVAVHYPVQDSVKKGPG